MEQSAESPEPVVVMPDMTDPLEDKSEVNEDQSSPHPKTVSVTAVDGVPVSAPVPVASLINVAGGATAFNVITPEQLQLASGGSLRPILCVDNSCICDSHNDKECNDPNHRTQWFRSENGHLKATTHIVIENNEEGTLPNSASWLASASQAVIPIRCKSTSAELHKSRFGSGGRGRCILYINQWYTPSEFETLCGRGSSKDWKRSIRFGGRSLQSLIDGGFLTPHATSCTCSACCDDDRAVGPVRLFSPYKRKRRRDPTEDDSRKIKHDTSVNGNSTNGEESYDSGDLDQTNTSANNPNGGSNLEPKSEVDGSFQVNGTPNVSESLNRLDKMTSKMMKLIFSLRKEVEDAKVQWKAEKDQLISEHKRDKEQAVLTARVEAQVACSRVFDSTVHVVDPSITAVGLQPSEDNSDSKKCANCNREAFAECSLCRRTPYCSTFCQRKDWGSHQVECVRSATNDQSSSIMLIVESSDQVLGVQE